MSRCLSLPASFRRLLPVALGVVLLAGKAPAALAGGSGDVRIWGIRPGKIQRAYDALPRADGGLWLLASALPAERRTMPVELSRWAPGGRLLWTRTILDSVPFDIRFHLVPEPAGEVVVAGRSGGALRIWRFSEAGELLWGRQVAADPADPNEAVTPDGKGGLYVAVRQPPSGKGSFDRPEISEGETRIFHYSKKGLLQQSYSLAAVPECKQAGASWLATAPLGIQHPVAIAALPAGGIAVVGYFAGMSSDPLTRPPGSPRERLDYGWLSSAAGEVPQVKIFVDRWDDSGRRLWSRLFGRMWNNLAFAVAGSERGAVAIAGSSVWGACPGDRSLRPSGLRLFVAEYGGEPASLRWCREIENNLSIGPMALRYGADGSLWLLGEAKGPLVSADPLAQAGRVYVARLDSVGRLQWRHQFGEGTSRPFPHIALGPEDRPAVAWATAALGSRHRSQEGESISVGLLPEVIR
ncbi:protein of unknown function [Methylacidimicrobium sp. AP8]|uniref:hypothetical protein n=1 Tax=Methylacidimicrobium sp. AP8 TaxID=2730359 RepID=UPI0018C1002C|nr:hypothetical protein [Methylacidimicrobium sp. AP8]CAB4242549.1 protein of unknown function [Methylacidimicrobium sp. AP8]